MQAGGWAVISSWHQGVSQQEQAPSELHLIYPTVSPHSIGCPQGSAGPTKVAAERTLARVLSLEKGIEPALAWVPQGGPLARTIMQVGAVWFG